VSEPAGPPIPLRTPLYAEHLAAGAHLAPFGGWEMPIDYGSIMAEHHACRRQAGLFDISHMGEFLFDGPGALALVSALITNDPASLPPGQGQYAAMCRDDGTIVDDVIVYRLPPGTFYGAGGSLPRYLMVVNAANIAKDWAWVREVRAGEGLDGTTSLEDRSANTALLALQGPLATGILAPLTPIAAGALATFAIAETIVGGIPALVARTGYTGEDGFEIFVAPDRAATLWRTLLEHGGPAGLLPVGLGARDTLRLEARLPLYGNDITDTTTPLEAGLSRFVKLDKPHFRGKEALLAQKQHGLARKLVGIRMDDRGVPRGHNPVLTAAGERIGEVTSGTFSPTLGAGIALAYVPIAHAALGTALQVGSHRWAPGDQGKPATVVKTPFYRRAT